MVFFRPTFKKLQKELIKTPAIFFAFWFYMVVKATAGIAGILKGPPESLKTVLAVKPRKKLLSRPLVSVIVPCFNNSATLGACLQSIKDQSYPTIELIVVDNNSTDNTKEIAQKYTDNVFNRGPERSAQRNYGVDQSSGEYVLIIDSDMELTRDVVQACVKKAANAPEVKGIVIPEESFGEGFWAQCKKLERSFYIGVDWMEAARFFTRQVFAEAKGYDEQNTGTEDYDLPQRIRAKHGRQAIVRIDQLIMHNEQKISLTKTCKKKFYYAQRLDRYKFVAANQNALKKQSNPFVRYHLYLKKPFRFFRNPLIGFGMIYMKTAEFIFGGFGYLIAELGRRRIR